MPYTQSVRVNFETYDVKVDVLDYELRLLVVRLKELCCELMVLWAIRYCLDKQALEVLDVDGVPQRAVDAYSLVLGGKQRLQVVGEERT